MGTHFDYLRCFPTSDQAFTRSSGLQGPWATVSRNVTAPAVSLAALNYCPSPSRSPPPSMAPVLAASSMVPHPAPTYPDTWSLDLDLSLSPLELPQAPAIDTLIDDVLYSFPAPTSSFGTPPTPISPATSSPPTHPTQALETAPQPESGLGLYSPPSTGFASPPSLVYDSSPSLSPPPPPLTPSSSSSIPVEASLPETQSEDHGVALDVNMPWLIDSETGRRKCPYHSLESCTVWAEKEFRTAQSRERHMLTHRGEERKVACPGCGKLYVRWDAVLRHARTTREARCKLKTKKAFRGGSSRAAKR